MGAELAQKKLKTDVLGKITGSGEVGGTGWGSSLELWTIWLPGDFPPDFPP